jgi:hypothetical protein
VSFQSGFQHDAFQGAFAQNGGGGGGAVNLLGSGDPGTETGTDGPYTLGADIVSSVSVTATAIRFYKPDADTSERRLCLWTTGGTLLAEVFVTPGAAAGWYQGAISYTLAANTTYRISYYAPVNYRSKVDGLTSDIVNGTLKMLAASGTWEAGNTFPNGDGLYDHYCADIEVGGGGTVSVSADAACSIDFIRKMVSDSFLPATYLNSLLNTFGNGIEWRSGINADAAAPIDWNRTMLADAGLPANWNEIVQADPQIPTEWRGTAAVTINGDGSIPVEWKIAANADGVIPVEFLGLKRADGSTTVDWRGLVLSTSGYRSSEYMDFAGASFSTLLYNPEQEIGTQFYSTVSGRVMGIRWYRHASGPVDTEGRLWDKDAGTEIAQCRFITSGAGWHEAYFANPVEITANKRYIVSYRKYFGTTIHYSEQYFQTAGYSSGNLVAPGGGSEIQGIYADSGATLPTVEFQNRLFFVSPIFQAIAQTNEFPVESLVSRSADSTLPWDERLDLKSDATAPTEWRGTAAVTIDGDSSIPVEWRVSVASDSSAPTDRRLTLTLDNAMQSDWLLLRTSEGSVPFDIRSIRNADAQVVSDWQSQRVADASAPIELLAVRRAEAQIPGTWSGIILSNSTAALEFRKNAPTADSTTPVTWQKTILGDAQAPITFLGTQRADSQSPAEWLGTAYVALDGDGAIPVDWLTITQSSNLIPFNALRIITGDAQAPSDFRILRNSDNALTINFSGLLRSDSEMPATWSRSLTSDSVTLQETLSGRYLDFTLPANWTRSMVLDQTLHVESSRSMSSEHKSGFEWLISASADMRFPVVYATTISVNGKIPTEWIVFRTGRESKMFILFY